MLHTPPCPPTAPDFGKTAHDYGTHRQGFPPAFFARLITHGVIKPGLQVVDLGTGTGTLARGFALAGCHVTALDPSAALLAKAREQDVAAGVVVQYLVASAEQTTCATATFDVVSAGQCWHWFDPAAAIAEVKRVLKPHATVVIAHMDWLPLRHSVAALTEQLILQHNPRWAFAEGTGFYPAWATQLAEADFTGIETYTFDIPLQYTHDQWRGRIRASAGIGATLTPAAVETFDREHAAQLRAQFPHEPLSVLHRVFTLTATAP